MDAMCVHVVGRILQLTGNILMARVYMPCSEVLGGRARTAHAGWGNIPWGACAIQGTDTMPHGVADGTVASLSTMDATYMYMMTYVVHEHTCRVMGRLHMPGTRDIKQCIIIFV